MRKLQFIGAYFLYIILLFSCSDDDLDPNNPNLPDNTYDSIMELEADIDSLYAGLGRATQSNNFFVSAWAGDDLTTLAISSKADFRQVDRRDQYNTQNSRAAVNWINSFKIIKEINTVFYLAKNFETDEVEAKERLLGEAYFIRGFLNHHLLRMFGELPIHLEHEFDINTPISEASDVYKQIETDWLEAERLLPVIYPGVEDGAPRPNNGSAAAFLARLYLDWGGFPVKDVSKYGLSASMAKKVMDNHGAHGFGLMDDLDDLWTLEHRFNKESVFTVVHCISCSELGNMKAGKIGLPLDVGGWAESFGEIKFYETFPDNHRKKATYTTDILIEDPYFGATDGPKIHWTNLNEPHLVFAKITGKGDIPRTEFLSDRNDYMMRYAEVLLTYAEASSRSGNNSAEAWEALNKVRRRAELLPPNEPNASIDMTSGDLAELAYSERAWEFAGEFMRWFDLLRLERVSRFLDNNYRNSTSSKVSDPDSPYYGQIIQERVQIEGSIGTDNYFFPIPANYKDLYPKETAE